MRRRTFVRTGAAAAGIGVAGCVMPATDDEPDDDLEVDEPENDEQNGGSDDDGTLRIATYSSMVTGETPAGEWLTETFEAQFPDAELEWTVPESGIDHYVQRARLGAEIDADIYLGLPVDGLVLADVEPEVSLFETLDRSKLERESRIRDSIAFDDPDGRIVPFGVGYVAPVYDGETLSAPETLDDLLDERYENALLVQNPRYSTPGRAFLLWTIATYGDDYLEYWEGLLENGLEVHPSWTSAYRDSYLEGVRSMVVSYTTDQVAATVAERDLERHQVATPDGEAYRSVEGMAIFEETEKPDLAYEFLDFVLSREVQGELATRNVQFPAVEQEYVGVEEAFVDYAIEPDEPVTVAYDDIADDLETWIDAWESEIGD
ncbi:thiamine ABC transporter substrate-binding protein [Natrarchaeobaculum sulfurireducens]|uniref:ABC-type thiamine transport system, periplasmic component n=1 Tax=Natrarchaeobaculum sulfurireducens TaxID=2044521 RepID=A0A346PA20_9EURY|nr:thiamine ABC transporter substrate-binding protein [Natrarchaeobaculum sulfurireducens]AXR76365.1 ABC-type thiamine transport system, periplasmic component [Natrarchaeobaculum sulfurireducens]AXR80043.1 thiamine ABC transporter, substrate-binding component [Natrarchaeobaculum sulfurireducens]